ncbi:hypothetical protein L9F63_014012, partial [Diploptera punctata]
VPDSGGAPPGMDCMPLQRSPGPFHYLIHEQAKSLVALQELQNEVGALLEFRDLVMETFPHLRNKMVASGVAGITSSSSNISHTSSTPSSGTSNIPIPLTSSRREWEPGIRVRRKLQSHTSAKDSEISSGEGINSGSGNSSAGSSAVQDSGFGTETSSSKEHCHSSSSSTTTGPVVVHRPSSTSTAPVASSTVLDEAEDELWNLLDVIHRKGTKLREEVEHLQQSLQRERNLLLDKVADMEAANMAGRQTRSDDEIRSLQRERDLLLDKVSEMEAETLASRARASQLQNELGCLIEAKRDLEEQLKAAVSQKSELNSRIHDLHMQFVSGNKNNGTSSYAPLSDSERLRNVVSNIRTVHSQTSIPRQELSDSVKAEEDSGRVRLKLGTLDGIVSSPSRIARTARGVVPDPHKVAAILQEFSAIELQRHLLTTSVENKALHQRLEKTVKSHVDLVEQFEKIKDENDDLKFQLEEKSIELEGTRARVRVLERLNHKTTQDTSTTLPPILPIEATTNPILPLLALPMPTEENTHHSSSTESAHDHTVGMNSEEGTSDHGETKKTTQTQQMSPRRRPSKIPLPGTKSYCAPKPPSGKSASITSRSRGSPSLKSRTDSNPSLSGKTRESSWKNRSDSNSSLSGGNKSRESPSGGRNSSLSIRNNSRDSLNSCSKNRDSMTTSFGKVRGDSLSGKKSSGDSISSSGGKGRADTPSHQNSFSSNVSGSNRRESLIGSKGKDSSSFSSTSGRKGLHHQNSTSIRGGRGSNTNLNINQRIGNFTEQSDQNSKVRPTKLSFWSNWLKILDNGPS